jgi:hypothetical protein
VNQNKTTDSDYSQVLNAIYYELYIYNHGSSRKHKNEIVIMLRIYILKASHDYSICILKYQFIKSEFMN